MKNNFIQRAITGVLFVAILVGCILYHPFSFGALFIVISALTIREFGSLVNHIEGVSVNKNIIMLGGAYLFLAIMGFCIDASDSKIFLPYLLLLLYMMISELYLKKESPVLNWAFSMLSQLYIALPFALLSALALQELGKVSEADDMVKIWSIRFPNDQKVQWCTAIYHKEYDKAIECLKSRKEQIDSTPWENSFYDSNFDLLVRLFGL